MEFFDVAFRDLAGSCPHHGPSAMVNLQHVFLGLLFGELKDKTENPGHIAHEVHWIVMHHHIPRLIAGDLPACGEFGCFERGSGHTQEAERHRG